MGYEKVLSHLDLVPLESEPCAVNEVEWKWPLLAVEEIVGCVAHHLQYGSPECSQLRVQVPWPVAQFVTRCRVQVFAHLTPRFHCPADGMALIGLLPLSHVPQA